MLAAKQKKSNFRDFKKECMVCKKNRKKNLGEYKGKKNTNDGSIMKKNNCMERKKEDKVKLNLNTYIICTL